MNTQEWNPGRLLEMSGYYWKTCTLHAGVKLDVFTTIGDAHLRIEDIASNLGGDKRGVGMLLNALTAMNLLIKTDDQFSNTDAGKTFLSKASPRYIGYMIMHHHHLVHSWSQLDQAVKTGHPSGSRASFSDEVVRESFLMGMFNMAMSVAPMVVPVIDLSDRVHLLDLGGGPGTFAIHFCQQYEKLKATVYDLPTTRPFSEKNLAKLGL